MPIGPTKQLLWEVKMERVEGIAHQMLAGGTSLST
jgi:hypothetical protein